MTEYPYVEAVNKKGSRLVRRLFMHGKGRPTPGAKLNTAAEWT